MSTQRISIRPSKLNRAAVAGFVLMRIEAADFACSQCARHLGARDLIYLQVGGPLALCCGCAERGRSTN